MDAAKIKTRVGTNLAALCPSPNSLRADAPPSESVAALPWRIGRRAVEVVVRPCVE